MIRLMDFVTAGLLDGLEGEEREARRRLLERLAERGTPLAELEAAVAENRLVLLPVEQVLGAEYSARDISERSGVPLELVRRIRRLSGLPEVSPEDRVFSEEDIEAARATRQFLDAGFDDGAIAQITRVLGEGASRLAATVTAAFAETFLQPGDTEEDVALRFAAMAKALTPGLTPVLVAVFRAHLREAVRRGVLGATERQTGQLAGAAELAVCFADIVGFTRLGGEIEVHELGTVAGRLSELALEVADGPVRLVKTIGDAAMFVSAEPTAIIEAALSLLDAAEAAELPALRAGIAFGPAQQRSGDYYGHAVNLSSRVTGTARPGSVLCTQDVHHAAAEDFQWSFAGRLRLKGIHEPVALHRARWLDDGDDAGDAGEASSRRRARRRRA